jgi:hypothetical protein
MADDFHEYRRLIIQRLDAQDDDSRRLEGKLDRVLQQAIPALHTDVALLKAGAYHRGAVAGSITGLITSIVAAIAAYFLKTGGAH